MFDDRQRLFEELANAVLELDAKRTTAASQEVLDRGYDAWEAVDRGLIVGANRAGKLFDQEEYLVPELLIAADAMYAGLAVLSPRLKKQLTGCSRKVATGDLQGDTDDIGKNFLRILLEDLPPPAEPLLQRQI